MPSTDKPFDLTTAAAAPMLRDPMPANFKAKLVACFGQPWPSKKLQSPGCVQPMNSGDD